MHRRLLNKLAIVIVALFAMSALASAATLEPDYPKVAQNQKQAAKMTAASQAAETCAGKWETTLSHKSWRCIDGFWNQVTEEMQVCEKPHVTVGHSHMQPTQEACSTS